jgi:steroid delta-isomerase-like uncharacterized protein
MSNVDVVLKLYDRYAAKDYDGAAALVDPEIEWTVIAFGQTVRGVEGFRQMFAGFAIPFPDSQIKIKNVIDGGEWVVTEYNFVGTHNGPLATPTGEVPATGRPIDIPGIEVYRLRDGKIVEFRTYFDNATMMTQLGLMPQT